MRDDEVVVLKPPGEQAEQAPEEAKTEAPEEIVSLESIASEGVLQDESIPEPIPVKKSKKKLFIIIGAAALILVILIAVLLIVLLKKIKKRSKFAKLLANLSFWLGLSLAFYNLNL